MLEIMSQQTDDAYVLFTESDKHAAVNGEQYVGTLCFTTFSLREQGGDVNTVGIDVETG